jgi:hypothetical protein
VFTSMALVIGVFGVAGGCLQSVLGSMSNPSLLSAVWPLAPHTAIMLIVDPRHYLGEGNQAPTADVLQTCRVIAAVGAACSAGIYFLVGYGLHRDMVRNFDMIIRKQSA